MSEMYADILTFLNVYILTLSSACWQGPVPVAQERQRREQPVHLVLEREQPDLRYDFPLPCVRLIVF